ncbi:conserved hypothetical protein [Candida dubliniensis CD36]|uniref:Uncharacterized protein n=1 Tax=Candida dubliniensis (strain CD36 / ATCC MYA-646 / CBS 7987 / NCPF 3949 / NRRL Y-17841) TaxID=573826 RepID=B9WF49_CANDC|nr:conserved hypothetical protein [Candida dubliniensis CD36]CAX42505.1 conserved hypothetical protein [Candida dubliniensis CD36]
MSNKNTDLSKSLRFLQVSKLMRAFKPVTINGNSAKSVIKQVKEIESDNPDHFKRYKNHVRLSYLQKYLLDYMKDKSESPIYLSLRIKPSDPEFPYDLEKLNINLSIPSGFPEDKSQRPKISVLNEEIPRGFAYNVEAGFQRIVDIAQGTTKDDEIALVDGIGLTSMILTLDKYLELFLKQEKKETIKFVKTKKKSPPLTSSKPQQNVQPRQQPNLKTKTNNKPKVDPRLLLQRKKLLEEMCYKLNGSVRLLKDEVYRATIPVLQDTAPELWKLNGNIDLMLTVPQTYPTDKITVSLRNNFNENLVIKHCQEDQFEMVKIIKQYKKYEKNMIGNVKSYDFETENLTAILNYLANNIDKFVLDPEDFKNYNVLVNKLKAEMVST